MANQKINRVDDHSQWAKEAVQELLTLKNSVSDKPEEEQSGFIEEELEYLLSDVGAQSGELRGKLLRALDHETQEFSSFYALEDYEVPAEMSLSLDPVTQIEQIWKVASVGQREEVMQKLGLSLSVQDQIDRECLRRIEVVENEFTLPHSDEEWTRYQRAYKQLCSALKVKEGAEIPLVEFMEIFSESTQCLSVIQDYLKTFWDHKVSREDKNVIDPELSEPIEVRFVEALERKNEVSLKEELDLIRNLVFGVVFCAVNGGADLGVYYNGKYSPDNIENAVCIEEKISPSNKPKNMDALLWWKYSELAKYITAESVDDEFQKIIGKLLVKYLKSVTHKT